MNLATHITLSRILFSLVFILVFTRWHYSLAGVIVSIVTAILIEISDMVDGRIARARKEVTALGKLFDPIADTICHSVIFLSFLLTHVIPLWLFLVFFYREMLIIMLRMACLQEKIVVAARRAGKLKTATQAVAVFCILAVFLAEAVGIRPVTGWRLLGYHAGFWLLLAPAFFSVVSALDHFVAAWSTLRKAVDGKAG
jgi:CDP-diacylglycerol--glycerol-3-phosphate 3-phosphatidyltransferase